MKSLDERLAAYRDEISGLERELKNASGRDRRLLESELKLARELRDRLIENSQIMPSAFR